MILNGPDAGGGSPSESAKPGGDAKKPRRRGSRGGRGRGRGKTGAAAPAAGAAGAAPVVKSRSRTGSRRKPPTKTVKPGVAAPAVPVVEDVPVPSSSEIVEQQTQQAPAMAEPEMESQGGDTGQAAPPVGPGSGTGFTPAPPRVGMRPAVIRPAPPTRMSFSKGNVRHQFRPSGFRPPRPFTPPPAGGASAEAPAMPGAAPQQELPVQTPQPQPQRQPQHRQQQQQHGNRNQPQQHRGDHQRGPQQRQGGQQHGRQDQRQGHGGHRGPQQHPPGGGQRQQPPLRPAMPAPVIGETPVETPVPQETNGGQDLVQLSPQPVAAPADALTPSTNVIAPSTPGDSTALAPFAEDVEIEEDLAAQQPRRRELTGRDMLINVVEGEEVRIAVVRRGVLEELYMERSSTESHIGNIYKGRVTNVEPSIQAAFIDFGVGKNGFLHISDLHPVYFPKKMQPRMPQGRGGRNQPRRQQQGAVPAQGFQPPQGTSAAEGADAAVTQGTEQQAASTEPVAEKAIEAQPLAHEMASDSPGVSMEQAAREVAPMEAVEPLSPEAEAEAAAGAEQQAARIAEGQERAAESDESNEDGEDEDAEPTIPTEEPADFGSAYTSEFGDDFEEEFAGAGGEDELDDGHMKPMEKVGRKTPRRERPPIQQCLRRGQEVIVQVTKEGIGTKGPTLTTYVSCPGRYLVMMPGMQQLGVSRKIEDLEQRRELKRTLQELNPPRNLGFIIRTAGTEVAKKELQGDLNYLVRMWKVIANRIRGQKAPVELYQESDLVIRTIRDVFSDEIDRIIVDNEQVASRIRDFLSIVDPRSAGIVELYTGTMPLFQKFGVEREIEKINARRVELPNGGSLVIDSAEALVAIDVNSGRYREQRDAELTAFNMNKEALKEVVRQLRLRDLGGVIVIDFIDMREERHKREIEHLLREELKNDRARTKVLRMSQFCMIELTRQRVRPSLKRSIYMDCPHCHGSALIKTPESVSLDVMRRLAAGATRLDVSRLDVKAYPSVATFLLNRKRKALVELEEKTNKRITITPDESLAGDQIVIAPYDGRNSLLNLVL